MSVSTLAAANAYALQAKEIAEAAKIAGGAPPVAEGGFSSALENAVNALSETGRAADQQMQMQAMGQGNIVDVVTSVAEAELTVQTIVAVRDRVLNAYQEILRMPI